MDKSNIYIVEKDVLINTARRVSDNEKKINKELLSKMFALITYLVIIPLVIALGVVLFKNEKYNIISMVIVILALFPAFINFERSNTSARELVMIAVMISLAVVGRLVFALLPSFKPVTAIVIITGVAFGGRAGFITGAMTAFVSNFFYGQGPWTPFQMFAWGIIGLFAGLIFNPDKKINLLLLCLIGVLGGVLFSLVMDIWTTISVDGIFLWQRYLTLLVSGLPFTIIYAVSNVVFLLLGATPLLSRLNRIRQKYGVFRRK